ncbi:Protein of unknown function [Gryllus bimaculatus]|nr:Protein of unknown function [Gryllus bimaculatus]
MGFRCGPWLMRRFCSVCPRVGGAHGAGARLSRGALERLWQPVGVAAGERPHECPACGAIFTRAAYLLQHVRAHHRERLEAEAEAEAEAFRLRGVYARYSRNRSSGPGACRWLLRALAAFGDDEPRVGGGNVIFDAGGSKDDDGGGGWDDKTEDITVFDFLL